MYILINFRFIYRKKLPFETSDDENIGDEAALFDTNDSKTLLNTLLVTPGQFEL